VGTAHSDKNSRPEQPADLEARNPCASCSAVATVRRPPGFTDEYSTSAAIPLYSVALVHREVEALAWVKDYNAGGWMGRCESSASDEETNNTA
jgi:hypothetical protein